MKKILMVLIAAIFVAACSTKPANDEQAKRKQLEQYKQQMQELKQEIDLLEADLKTSEKEKVVNVNVMEIEQKPFEHFIEVTGNVEAEYDLDVSPESAGVISDVFVTEGQNIQKGFVMARLNTDVLERNIDELKIQLDLATTTYTRQKNLWEQSIGSEMQLLQAKNNMESIEKRIKSLETQIAMSEIKAPISGVVDVVYQKKGHIGSPQIPFAKVINTSEIKVYADVSESYITAIKNGDLVKVFFPALSSEIDTPIRQIGKTIDPNNRTFRVRMNLSNSSQMIKPNLASVVKIRDYYNESAIVIPSLLIKKDFKGDYTYIAENTNGKNIARKVYVKPGVSQNNMTEVTEGLQAGVKVISEGFNQIADGTVVVF
jgi:membrane fusion protein, multidrug efflux system